MKYGIVCSKYNYKQSEIEKEDGWMVYDFEGIDIGIEHEIEVTANGKILEVEQEDENNSAEYS